MTTENLRIDIAAIPGAASSEVTTEQRGTPVARVWLDGTEEGSEAKEFVIALFGKSVPDLVEVPDEVPRRRSGLGRGLGDLLPEDDSDPVPSQLQPEVSSRLAVSTVSVIESSAGVLVTVTDNKERQASVTVGDDGSIDSAVISAISKLFGIDDSIRVSVEDLHVAKGSLLVALASNGDTRSAGAAFVEFGRPSAVARAAFQAMAGLP
ncbi:MAG: hypothetical protein ACC654_05915 [Acidimicrobiia bacterium]